MWITVRTAISSLVFALLFVVPRPAVAQTTVIIGKRHDRAGMGWKPDGLSPHRRWHVAPGRLPGRLTDVRTACR
jgi:hypothetical protein